MSTSDFTKIDEHGKRTKFNRRRGPYKGNLGELAEPLMKLKLISGNFAVHVEAGADEVDEAEDLSIQHLAEYRLNNGQVSRLFLYQEMKNGEKLHLTSCNGNLPHLVGQCVLAHNGKPCNGQSILVRSSSGARVEYILPAGLTSLQQVEEQYADFLSHLTAQRQNPPIGVIWLLSVLRDLGIPLKQHKVKADIHAQYGLISVASGKLMLEGYPIDLSAKAFICDYTGQSKTPQPCRPTLWNADKNYPTVMEVTDSHGDPYSLTPDGEFLTVTALRKFFKKNGLPRLSLPRLDAYPELATLKRLLGDYDFLAEDYGQMLAAWVINEIQEMSVPLIQNGKDNYYKGLREELAETLTTSFTNTEDNPPPFLRNQNVALLRDDFTLVIAKNKVLASNMLFDRPSPSEMRIEAHPDGTSLLYISPTIRCSYPAVIDQELAYIKNYERQR